MKDRARQDSNRYLAALAIVRGAAELERGGAFGFKARRLAIAERLMWTLTGPRGLKPEPMSPQDISRWSWSPSRTSGGTTREQTDDAWRPRRRSHVRPR